MPYVAGIFDLQVNKMDAELALNMDEYFDTALGPTPQSFKTPLFRSIPVQRQLAKKPETDLYEPPKTMAETYIRLAMERGKI